MGKEKTDYLVGKGGAPLLDPPAVEAGGGEGGGAVGDGVGAGEPVVREVDVRGGGDEGDGGVGGAANERRLMESPLGEGGQGAGEDPAVIGRGRRGR